MSFFTYIILYISRPQRVNLTYEYKIYLPYKQKNRYV